MVRTHVLICGGTGCTSSKSEEIMKVMEAEIEAKGLSEEVKVVKTGCFGLCALGPIMIVYPEGTFYHSVTVENVAEIVEEHITRADFYGFVVPFVNALNDLSREAGIPIKIRMCDTMGYGVSYPGVALPRSVPGIVYGLHHYANVSSEMLEWHGHNDFYQGVTNAVNAWLYGACAVNCSLLGISLS